MKALKEDKANKIPIKEIHKPHDDFMVLEEKWLYLFPIESINPILSMFSLKDKDGQQSGQGRSLPRAYQ